MKLFHNNRRENGVELNTEMVKNYNVKCSVTITKERLRCMKLFGQQPAKKQLVLIKNHKARIKFAQEHLNLTQQQWSKILWSDKSKFMIFNPKYQLLIVKHGSINIMV